MSIKASDVLMARTRLNKNRVPGDDGVVTEMVLLLPLSAMYFVARIFDDRFSGCNEMATTWRSIIMRLVAKNSDHRNSANSVDCACCPQ